MELEEIIGRLEAVEGMSSELEAILAKWFAENAGEHISSGNFRSTLVNYLFELMTPDGWGKGDISSSNNEATVVLNSPYGWEPVRATAKTMAHAMRIACMKAHKVERDAKQKAEKGFVEWEWFEDLAYFNLFRVRPVNKREFGHGFHLANRDEAEALCDLLNKNEVSYG